MPRSYRPLQRQRGVALFVVLVFVMLSMLLALWASRTSLFNEMVVGNDADYQRAFEATQALLQDAELDITNKNADGTDCSSSACRQKVAFATKLPLEGQDVGPLLAALDNETTKCRTGLCIKRVGKQDFWNNTDPAKGITLAQMTSGAGATLPLTAARPGARYGDFTGASKGVLSNPILADDSKADAGGWYWIEVLPYDESSKTSGLIVSSSTTEARTELLPLNLSPNVVYRITALAYGRKPGTLVVLQETYAQQKVKD